MKRLVDEPELSAEAARLARAAATPLAAPAGRLERIRSRLVDRPKPPPSWRRPAALTLLAALLVVGAVLVARLQRGLEVQVAKSVDVPVERTVPPSVVVPPVVPDPIAPQPEPSRPAVAVRTPLASPTAKPVPSPPVATRPDKTSASLVFDAARAIHHEHAPKRALALLDEYMLIEPDGDLLQECLALVIEAKVALSDPTAVASAKAYVTRFPEGRFVVQARHVIEKNETSSKRPPLDE